MRIALAALLIGALATLTAACSGGTEGMSADSGDAVGGVFGGAPGAPDVAREEAPGPAVGDREVAGVNRTVVRVRSVIRTGAVTLTSRDPDAVRARLDGVLVAVGGTIDSEQTTHDDDGDIRRSTLVLRVPVDEFGNAMTRLQELGKVRSSDTASKDVTAEVIDIDERVETLRNSLDRLQGYLAEAATLDDLLRFEQQITQREAELQSLKAQQTYYADQTSMSTITLHLMKRTKPVEPPDSLDDAGFLAGLKSGWEALENTVVVVLTVVGAVLPFAVVLLLVGVPTWLLVRRTVRGGSTPGAPDGTPEAPPPAI